MRTIYSKTRITVLLCLGLLLVCAETLLAQRVQILNATNTMWRYHPNSTDPGYSPADAWVDPAFDDSTWSGPSRGLFGTEGAGVYPYPIATQILPPNQTGGALVSSYFRVHFNWTGHAQGVELVFTNYIDDGLLVYLNGVELWAWNMPAERPVPWNISTLPGAANPIPEPTILMTNITANLIQGDNVLAVQLQQHGTGSSDDVFGMWMWGVVPFPPTNRVDTQPTNRVVLQSRPTTLSAVIDGSPPPTFQWYRNGVEIDSTLNPTATNANLVISQMTAGDAGDYYAIATNPAGSVQTRTATVGYTADAVAPRAVRAVGSPTFTTITIEYDEGMDSLTVTDAVNYAVSPPLTVLTADLAPNGSSVILTTAEPQAPDTVYTVTALNVYDFAGNGIAAPNNTAQFRSWINSGACSGVLFEAFSSTATTLPAFTNSPTYPNNPFTNAFIQGMHSRMAFPDNANNNYGGRMRALFIPLVSGNWRLYMSSDDPGELWFNPNGSGAAGRQRVAFETGCCQLYQPEGRNQTSPVFSLVAGQGYYIELIYKENAGGDYGMVAARLENDGIPTGGNDQGAEAGEAISGTVAPSRFVTAGFGAVPAGIAGTLSINQNLSNAASEANRRVTLSLGASAPNSPYVCYQWQRSDDNGVTFNDIPGATLATYTTPYLTQADDNGDIYRVVAGIPGVSVTSANATLTVTADVTRPRVTRVVGLNPLQIAVFFSEPMTPPSSASDAFAYEIDQGIQVGEAILNATNALRVDLTLTTPMTLGTTYQLTLSTPLTQLVDASGNAIDPNPTRINFRAINFTGDPETLITLPTNTKRPLGSLTQRGMAGRMIQVGTTIRPPLLPITEDILAGRLIDPGTGQPYPNLAPQPTFIETDTINYGDTPAGAGTGRLIPDRAFPGYTALADNMVMEILAYLELQEGIYTMGVNSDDDFQVTPALSATDPNNAIVLGQFSGGRGVADSTFSFYAPQSGLYPFRLIWNEYQGGAAGEWWILDLVGGSYIGVNGSDEIKAFVPSTAPRLNVARNAGAVTLSWTESGTLQQAPEIAGPWTDSLNQANPQTFNPTGKLFFRIRP